MISYLFFCLLWSSFRFYFFLFLLILLGLFLEHLFYLQQAREIVRVISHNSLHEPTLTFSSSMSSRWMFSSFCCASRSFRSSRARRFFTRRRSFSASSTCSSFCFFLPFFFSSSASTSAKRLASSFFFLQCKTTSKSHATQRTKHLGKKQKQQICLYKHNT